MNSARKLFAVEIDFFCLKYGENTMARTFQISLGPKNFEHTNIDFTPDKQIIVASIYSEQLDQWVFLNDEQMEKLENQDSVQRAMAEHIYQDSEERQNRRNEAV